ncbi:MAG: TolC family protein [Planctomycetes bacterium]|jgi:cobalt-zinc-cadmium efflux system outer membrane protein|nr:TolC family protein [Planctomycetota bacterium]
MRPGALLLLGSVLLCACTTAPDRAPAPVAPVVAAVPAADQRPAFPAAPGLAEVLARAVQAPRAEASLVEAEVERGGLLQASLPPNPEFSTSAERLGMNMADRLVPRWRAEGMQRIETAGKRGARVAAAEGRVRSSEARAREARIAVAGDAALLHQRLLALAARLAIRTERVAATAELLALRERQFAAGRTGESEIPPLRALLGERRAEVLEDRAELAGALRALEGLLALAPGTVTGASGRLLAVADLPPGRDGIAGNPEVLRLRAERAAAAARVSSEEAKAIPDVTVALGVENEEIGRRGHDFMGMAGVTMPLPLFDRNQGAIAAARAEVRRTEVMLREAEARALAEVEGLSSTAEELAASRRTLASEALPARERVLSLAEAAARGGRTDLVPAIEGRLAVLDLREAIIERDLAVAEKLVRLLAVRGVPPEEWAAGGSAVR